MTRTPAERQTLRHEVADGVATITFTRPERRNTFTATMCLELLDTLDTLDADDDVRAMVVTGTGPTFCAGADLEEGFVAAGRHVPPALRELVERAGTVDGVPRDGGGLVSMRLARLRKPVVAAVNGSAAGVGATMTLPMDVRVIGDSTRMGFVFARRGLVPEAASSWFLPRLVGISRAMEWVATGRLVDADELVASGLALHRVADEDVLGAAQELAREMSAQTAPVAVAASRQMMWSMLGAASPWEAHRLDSRVVHELTGGADVAEGVAAFLAKRPAAFPLRVSTDLPDLPPWPEPAQP